MNNYNELNDYELISLLPEDETNIKNIIYEKYKYIIDILIKKYFNVIKAFNVDIEELRCEALFGFSDGLNSYKDNKNATLKTFLTICIERRITKYLTKYTTKKAKILQETLSLEDTVKDGLDPLSERLSDDNKNNPLDNLTSLEFIREVIHTAKDVLSESEYEVFTLMIDNHTYIEIANILNKNPKQIDNAIQRIKSKMRIALEELN